MQTLDRPDGSKIKALVAIGSMVVFLMTIMVIVLIMQGNKRAFYYEHHEWWNGKGYPYGISGEEIPLCARIMAVARCF